MNDPAFERTAEYLDDLDAAEWPPRGNGFHYRATLSDPGRLAKAHIRGLCTDEERDRLQACYEYAAGMPGGWKWWLMWTIRRDMRAAQGVNHVQ